MKLNSWRIVGGISALLLCAYALWLWFLPQSHSNLSAYDPRLMLIVPRALRNIDVPSACETTRYDVAPIECAGVCGTVYRLKFGTTLDQASANTVLDLPKMTRALAAKEINLLYLGGDTCRKMSLEIYVDERLK